MSNQTGSDPPRSFGQALRRGLTKKCPRCGRGELFAGMLKMNRGCSECRFSFERGPGYFLGSTYLNYGLTAGTTTVAYVVLHFGFGLGNSTLLPGLLVFCAVFPLLFFAFARSLWLNLDCFFDPEGAREGRDFDGNHIGTENAEKN